MVAIRTGKYSGVAVFVSLAVPLELFAGSAQPHVETEVRQPGYSNDLQIFLQACGLVCRRDTRTEILHVHHPAARSDRDARIVITKALSEWMVTKPHAEAHLIDYRD